MTDTGYVHWQGFLDGEMIAMARFAAIKHREKFVSTTVTTNEAGHRKSKVLWHFEYPDLYQRFTDRIRFFLGDLRHHFEYVPLTPSTIECQLTIHNDGEYFKRHLDNGSSDTATRVLTFVYYFTLDDEQKFTGGQLRLETPTGIYDIEPKHNTIIFFPSGYWHEVLPTYNPSGRWEDSRLTLNGWIRR